MMLAVVEVVEVVVVALVVVVVILVVMMVVRSMPHLVEVEGDEPCAAGQPAQPRGVVEHTKAEQTGRHACRDHNKSSESTLPKSYNTKVITRINLT